MYHVTMVNSGFDEVQEPFTIDDLAREAGTTVRNVRALQANCLVPPPSIAGRTGYYGPEHLLRLRSVLRLQEDGFSLAALRRLFSAWETGKTLDEVLGLPRLHERVPGAGQAAPERDDLAPDPFEGFGHQRRTGRRARLFVVPTTIMGEETGSRRSADSAPSKQAAS